MPKAMPDRWKAYNPVGEIIEGTRFIPFKLPLRELISSRVEIEKRLDDRILLEKIPNLGLIIDLTDTNRYYDPSVFRKEGIKHTKIMIPGKKIPTRKMADIFIKTVKDFVDENKDNDKLIGVHCTHGINRTGYLICNYMISQMSIEPKEAMAKFASARGYEIERKNYIKDLQNLQKRQQQNWRNREQCNVQPKNRKERAHHGVQPNNWRERDQRDVQPNNWRIKHENDINNYHNLNNRPSGSSPHIYQPYRNSCSPCSNNSYHNNNRNNTPSYIQPSDLADETPNTSNYNFTMSYRPPRLPLDYYNRSTRAAFEPKRYSYSRSSNSHEKYDL